MFFHNQCQVQAEFTLTFSTGDDNNIIAKTRTC